MPENLHLTLAFLGECDAKSTVAAKSAIDALSIGPFALTLERVGRFRRDGGDIWWVGVRKNKPLLDLQRDLTNKLIEAGFRLDNREYKPHITLGREIVTDISPWQIGPFGETIYRIDLMKSERIKDPTFLNLNKKLQNFYSRVLAVLCTARGVAT